MDNSYFYVVLKFRRLNEASSSRSIRRISGDKEFYSIYPIGKGYVHIFSYLDCLLYARATLYVRVLCGPTLRRAKSVARAYSRQSIHANCTLILFRHGLYEKIHHRRGFYVLIARKTLHSNG